MNFKLGEKISFVKYLSIPNSGSVLFRKSMSIMIFLCCCNQDDCEEPINNTTNPIQLIEANYFGFLNTDNEGIDCSLILISTQDSFQTLERYVLDSIPINIDTDPSLGYRGVLKLKGESTVCTVQSDPPTNEEYQYVQVLYWELL